MKGGSRIHCPDRMVDDDLKLVLIEEYPGDPVLNHAPAFRFKMMLVGRDEKIGRIELRTGTTHNIVMYAGHVSFRVYPEHRGHRYAAKACKLLLPLARRQGLKALWITCNPDNVASRRTCELAVGELVEIVDLPQDTDMYQAGERQKRRYRIDL